MINYDYPNGDHCYRALHAAHAVCHSDDGKWIARATKADNSEFYEFEITGFEIVVPGVRYD